MCLVVLYIIACEEGMEWDEVMNVSGTPRQVGPATQASKCTYHSLPLEKSLICARASTGHLYLFCLFS
jgi:hypothetical protein